MRIKNVPFNINGEVKVRLQEIAKEYLESERAKYGGTLKLDEEGYYNAQLWYLIQELGPIMSMVWNPIINCEMILDEIDIKIPNEIIKEQINNIRNAYDDEFKMYLDIISKYKVNIEYFEFLAKVCTYYGYSLENLEEKLILKENDKKRLEQI